MSSANGPTPTDPRHRLGRWGEDQAADYLLAQGYELIDRNWRTRYGEIDLVMKLGETIVFVEVKTRRSSKFGLPEEAITHLKGQRLLELGQSYVVENDLIDPDWRVDLVAIEVDRGGKLVRCEHIPHIVLGW